MRIWEVTTQPPFVLHDSTKVTSSLGLVRELELRKPFSMKVEALNGQTFEISRSCLVKPGQHWKWFFKCFAPLVVLLTLFRFWRKDAK